MVPVVVVPVVVVPVVVLVPVVVVPVGLGACRPIGLRTKPYRPVRVESEHPYW